MPRRLTRPIKRYGLVEAGPALSAERRAGRAGDRSRCATRCMPASCSTVLGFFRLFPLDRASEMGAGVGRSALARLRASDRASLETLRHRLSWPR